MDCLPRIVVGDMESIEGPVQQDPLLFRKEARDAQKAKPLGAIRLASLHQTWVLTVVSVAGAIVNGLFAGHGARVSPSLAAWRRKQVYLHVRSVARVATSCGAVTERATWRCIAGHVP